ncbi:MAG: polymer-forming cytoskeletal protein [Rickettsiales bacterium]|nr:polymer-forming cytoskeletal protein [Rickettsiales bacterium]
MFKRKEDDIDLLSEAGGNMPADTNEKNEPQMATAPAAVTPMAAAPEATAPVAAAAPAAVTPMAPAGGYTRPAESATRPASFRPGGEATRPAGAGRPGSDYRPAGGMAAAPMGAPSEKPKPPAGRRVLTVGHDILLKGEIATCDRLVIEGAVDAVLNEVHTVEISETGSFKGAAEIEDAEISGEFDGELTVRGRLVIYATGKVRGKITYGEIEIERGGELTGTIKSYSPEAAKKAVEKSSKKEKAAA